MGLCVPFLVEGVVLAQHAVGEHPVPRPFGCSPFFVWW